MPAFHAQHVLRHDGKHAAQREGPERGGAQQDSHTDAADVRTREIEPLAVEDSSQHQLCNKRSDDRERRSFVALENAIGEMADEQDESDKERRDVAIVEAKLAPDGNVKSRCVYRLDCGLAHADSLILRT